MATPMNPEIKALWLAALRSGEYEQGNGQLGYEVDNNQRQFCCLGVLCDLALKSGAVALTETVDSDGNITYASTTQHYGPAVDRFYLPEVVMDWSGMPDDRGYLDPDNTEVNLGSKNDSGFTFAEIADIIEANF